MGQLSLNLSAILLAGIGTLFIQRRLYMRRRREHLHDEAREAAGLPIGHSRRAPGRVPSRAPSLEPASRTSRTASDLALLVGVFAAADRRSPQALGAANFGTALTFGQLAFAVALVWAAAGARLSGQAPAPRSASSSSATRRSSGVVTLRFSAGAGLDQRPCRPSARRASRRRSPARQRRLAAASASRSAAARNACGVCAAHRWSRSSVAATGSVGSASARRHARLTVSVIGGRRDHAGGVRVAPRAARPARRSARA